jgi:hypothetical protein
VRRRTSNNVDVAGLARGSTHLAAEQVRRDEPGLAREAFDEALSPHFASIPAALDEVSSMLSSRNEGEVSKLQRIPKHLATNPQGVESQQFTRRKSERNRRG